MGGTRSVFGQRPRRKDKVPRFDFLPWNHELLYPEEYYKSGKRKPMPGRNAKSLRKAVSRIVMGVDNLQVLGDRDLLTGEAHKQWVKQND